MCKPIDNWGAPADFLQFQMDLGLEKKNRNDATETPGAAGPTNRKWLVAPTL